MVDYCLHSCAINANLLLAQKFFKIDFASISIPDIHIWGIA